jgi:RsiW-degrading membrane proteinase PrsW (M82 family)
MILLFILIALFISWIWVDYYRLIDIYDRDELKNFIFAFIIGGLSIPITFSLHAIMVTPFGMNLNGEPLNDLIYSIYSVAVVEESSKLLAFLIFVRFFKKHLTEPLDYLAYACTSALGFAAIENVMYFNNHGAQIVFGRAILSTILHMMCTATVVYGYLVYTYRKKKSDPFVMVLFFLLAVLQHGLFDFFLFQSGRSSLLVFGAILLYFTFISAFASMLNNSINQSKYYSHHHSIHSSQVATRLLAYYVAVYVLQFALLFFFEGASVAVWDIGSSFATSVPIVFVAAVRLSRFKLRPKKWFPIRYELPFGYIKPAPYEKSKRSYFSIKGESFNEVHVNTFFERTAWMKPVSKKNWIFKPDIVQVYIEDKLFLDYDETYYLARVYASDRQDAEWKAFIIKPKKSGTYLVNTEYPIVALLSLPADWLDVKVLKRNQLEFEHWVYLKPINK